MLPTRIHAAVFALLAFQPACSPAPARNETHDRYKMFGLLEKFDRFDYDGDGYLTRKELEDGVRGRSAIHLTPEQYGKVMKAYDTNRDSRISLHEAEVGAKRGPEIFREVGL